MHYTGVYYSHGMCCVEKEVNSTIHNVPLKGDFTASLYFSIVTWTTLGYGDFSPEHNIRIIAALQAMLGYVSMGVFVGLLANEFAEKKQQNSKSDSPPPGENSS